jgi:hypothetical protein
MSAAPETNDARPWYRHVWPWLLMLPPIASVCGGVTMIWLATSTPATLVVEDYAEIEAITAARFSADAQAATRGLAAQAQLERVTPDELSISIALTDPSAAPAGMLHLQFRHATDSTGDRDVIAQQIGSEYKARVQLREGTYLLEIEPVDRSWRLATRLQPFDRHLELTATGSQSPETTR